jgi:hypothetical protein
MLGKLSKSLVVRVGLLLTVVLAGAFVFAPKAQAASACDGWTASAPSDVPWGASFEILWPTVPGAASYRVVLQDADGTTVVTGAAGSLTVQSNDVNGGLLNYTIEALTPDGNVLCSTGGAVSFYTAPSQPPGKPKPPPEPQLDGMLVFCSELVIDTVSNNVS